MSLSRVVLVCLGAISYQLASTPPNKSPRKGRYATDELFILRIAPLVFKIQQPLVWVCTAADTLLIASQIFVPANISHDIQSTLCPHPSAISTTPTPHIQVTSFLIAGIIFILFGTILRLTCYRTLGPLFTFDLAILPAHTLITNGPYRLVRHPAYTGSLSLILGLGLAHLGRGGWVTECSILGPEGEDVWSGAILRMSLFVVWYAWWLAVGVRRAQAEDEELRKRFGETWDKYAQEVRWWFVPGVL